MKYWRGYLCAAIFGAITWALMEFAKTHQALTDMVYPYFTRLIQTALAGWSAEAEFLLWQFAVVVLIIVALATIVLMIVLRWNVIQWFGWVTALVSFLFMCHTGLYGLNQYAGPLADDMRMEVVDYSVSQLAEATLYYRDKANELAQQVSRDGSGDPDYADFHTLSQQAAGGFEVLTYERKWPVFAGSTLPVKELGWADMYSSMGITGFHSSLTGEAAVNPQVPPISLPFNMCHEMAHRMCIANERDANFAAFLACEANPDISFRYSAYFMAFRFCYNALASVPTTNGVEALSQVKSGISDLLQQDMVMYNDFFLSKKDETATQIANTTNDTYIKLSGDEMGVDSYGTVVDLLVSWHIREVVLPQHEEEPVHFDPYDEDFVAAGTLPPEEVTVPETTAGED